MLFTSLEFIVFLTVLVICYYTLPKKLQWPLLLCASLVFYYSISHKLIVFELFAAGCAWLFAQMIERLKQKEKQEIAKAKERKEDRAAISALRRRFVPKRRLVLILFFGSVIGLLAVFKFYNLFAEAMAKHGAALPLLRFAMPLGISFYSLMLVTYFMDVYNGLLTAEKNPARVMLFTGFFPLVIQGPIVRYGEFAPQVFKPHTFSFERLVRGSQRMLWGYFKKLMIADRLNPMVAALYSGYEQYQGFYVAVAAVAFTVQLYADFSGGIDIALGAAEILGIDLPENFMRPFFSKSVAEFWRRWHMTLGGFLRDYLFYPLLHSQFLVQTGRRLKKSGRKWCARWIPVYIAMFVVWLISGIWHGEGWQYVLYGLWNGFFIVLGNSIAAPCRRVWQRLGVAEDSQTLKIFRILRTGLVILIGELIFRCESVAMMCGMFRGLFAEFNPWVLFDGSLLTLGIDAKEWIVLLLSVGAVFAVSLAGRKGDVRSRFNKLELPLRWIILLFMIFCIAVFGVYGPAYDSTPFIYYQF